MDERTFPSVDVRTALAALALLAAVGGVGFWAWRTRAPLSRAFLRAERERDGREGERGPNPQRNPGTAPL